MENATYSKKWQKRFEFFKKISSPTASAFHTAYDEESVRDKLLYVINYWALFFNVFYFFKLGLWKKNLTLLGITACMSLILFGLNSLFVLPSFVILSFAISCFILWALTANYAYYLKEIKGSDSWNPFEGMA